MTPKPVAPEDRAKFDELIAARAATLEHFIKARQLATQRKELINRLVATGYSQSDIARELGVTRQAVQKMIKVG